MANPDVRRDTGAPEPSIETRGASPEIVYLPESFDLGAFPSEEPVEPTVASAPPLQEVAVGAVSAAGEPVAEPTPVASEVTPEEPPAVATFSSTGPSLYSAEPSPVLEFSVRPSAAKPADLNLITDASEPLTLLQVLDSGGHVSWREAVAIVHQLCVQLKDVPSHAPVLIEPGSIRDRRLWPAASLVESARRRSARHSARAAVGIDAIDGIGARRASPSRFTGHLRAGHLRIGRPFFPGTCQALGTVGQRLRKGGVRQGRP